MRRTQVLRLAHWAAMNALIVNLILRLSHDSGRRPATVCQAQAQVNAFGFICIVCLPPVLLEGERSSGNQNTSDIMI